MPKQLRCPVCGTPLPRDAPEGFCPRCSFGGALEAKPEATEQTAEAAEGEIRNQFGDYELLEEIAHGGMGVVWKARQVSLNRTVAVKLIRAGPFASREFVHRFRMEASAAAVLQHPNIVAVHEVGVHERRHFFSMDYVAGKNLAQLVREGPLPPKRATRYVQKIAEAIHYAHTAGILHRDLKPSNVLIDSQDQPRITDFGLAKQLHGDSAVTLTGEVIGTPAYMAPEQASRNRGAVKAWSDVYCLGAILYHLLTGRAPFVAGSLEETLEQVLHEDPPSARLVNPAVPRDLDTICQKCLEKEPSRRYLTAQALADELGRFLANQPIHARPLSAAGRAWRWCRRNPGVASAAAIALLSLVSGLAGVTWQWRRTTASELSALRNAYAADMNAVLAALQKGDREESLFLLNAQRPRPGQPDLRGWEWRYLWQVCRSDPQTNEPPVTPQPTELPIKAWIGGIGFSPDARQFVALDLTNGAASLWETATMRRLEDLAFLGTDNRAVKWSPDGKMLAVGDESGNLKVWDFQSRNLITNCVNPGMRLGVLRFAGGGRSLWCGLLVRTNGSRRARVWNVASGANSLCRRRQRIGSSGLRYHRTIAQLPLWAWTALLPGGISRPVANGRASNITLPTPRASLCSPRTVKSSPARLRKALRHCGTWRPARP